MLAQLAEVLIEPERVNILLNASTETDIRLALA
jgi:mannitol/fructose-specific phosphotransferase system IIA component (Ntr-type)